MVALRQVGACAIAKITVLQGTSGIFATMFPNLLEEKFGPDFANRAGRLFYKMSVVENAMTAITVGVRDNGVSAMHDATECGIWGGV